RAPAAESAATARPTRDAGLLDHGPRSPNPRPAAPESRLARAIGNTRRPVYTPISLLEPRVERVAQAVAEQIEPEHGDEDRQAGEERDPRVRLDERDVGLEIPAPTRRRRLRAEPKERKRRLHDDRRRDAERRRHDDRRQAVRQDVAEQDPRIAHADGA